MHCPLTLTLYNVGITNFTRMKKKTLLDNIKSVLLNNILEQSDSFINNIRLFGDTSLDDSSNTIILNATINYVTSTERFDDSNLRFKRNNKAFLK